jgi:hygromycin-B 4-O-kinase
MRSTSTKNESATQIDKFRRLARFVVEHHFGSRPSRITYRSGGLSNFVFEATHAEGSYIIRISPDKARLNAFIKEQWCERTVRKIGVPTAEILETGSAIIPFPYVIARSIEGIDGTDHPERKKILVELGRLAAKINSVRTRGFGETFDWSANLLSRNESLKDYLAAEYGCEARLETLRRHRVASTETLKRLERIIRDMGRIKDRPSLSHSDLRLKNVLADPDGKIVAIIDWEKAISNIAPQWELSIALHDLGIDEKEAFIQGYGITSKRLSNIAPYVKAFNLMNYVDEVNRAAAAKDKAALDRVRMRFSGNFDMYSLD